MSVFDRLNNVDEYTGVYAERFKGGGGKINGYTADSDQIQDLSQITRTNLRNEPGLKAQKKVTVRGTHNVSVFFSQIKLIPLLF